MKRKSLFALVILATTLGSCKKCYDHNNPDGGDTTGGTDAPNCLTLLCTQEFAQVVLEVKNPTGTAVILDSFVVTDLSATPLAPVNGNAVFGPINAGTGGYAVINDAWVKAHRNTTMQVRAKGFINGAQIFNEPYTISVDCCHVRKISGTSSVTIP